MRPLAWSVLLLLACGRVEPLTDEDAGPGPEPEPDVLQPLTVAVVGTGVVRSTPAAIDCGATCTDELPETSTITLDAVTDPAHSFLGWEGDCSGTSPCVLSMDRARSVTARFIARGTPLWAETVGGPAGDDYLRIVTDGEGNVVAAGTAPDGNPDLVITKLARGDGSVVWSRRFATPAPVGEIFGGLAVDGAGHAYLAARIVSTDTAGTYDDKTATGDNFGNILVLKLDAADGHVIWAKTWGGEGQDIPAAITVSGDDLYVVGSTSSAPAIFDSKSIAADIGDGFLVRARTSDGEAVALRHFDELNQFTDVAVNGLDVALTAIMTTTTTTIDPGCVLTKNGANSNMTVLDVSASTLTCRWAKTFADTTSGNTAVARVVFPFPGGGWAIAGIFEGRLALAAIGAPLVARGVTDAFVARFDAEGNHLWSLRYGGDFGDEANGVRVTPEGEVVLGGMFDDSIAFGALTLTGEDDIFVLRLSNDPVAPVPLWAVALGGDVEEVGGPIALAPDGAVYVMSQFTGVTDVGGESLTSQARDAWIAALVP